MEPKIIFEDNDILVLDKPAGMVVNKSDTTVGEKTVQEWVEGYLKIRSTKHEIRNKYKIQNSPPRADQPLAENVQNDFEFRPDLIGIEFSNRAGIVHRLDKETSGIILVAKTKEAFENLQKQFKERQVKKTYIALVHGEVKYPVGEINVPVGRLPWNRKRFGVLAEGREAVTKYKVLRFYEVRSGMLEAGLRSEKWDPYSDISHRFLASQFPHHTSYSLLELYPETGRTHQIRVHLKYFGHPIFADPLYAGRKTARNDRKLLPRIFLHASKISIYHPASPAGGPESKELVSFESPLPEELQDFLLGLK